MSHDMNTLGGAVARELAAFSGGPMTNRDAIRSIARMIETRTLTRRELESARVIHREATARGMADAFREIRTRLLSLAGPQNFVTLIAPVNAGDGGSFVARNLTAAFAFDDAKTALLVDCNLRYPTQHAAFGVDPSHGGLIDYLEHPNRGVQTVLYGTGIPRVRLIPAGQPRESTAEHFSSYRMRALVEQLRARYPDRYVFLDGPALRGAPDARILSDLADYVVLVVAYGHDSAAQINQAVAGLDPKKVAGVVFNHPP